MEPEKPEAAEVSARTREAERLIGALQKAVRIVGYFSSRHQVATSALDELVGIATAATAEHGELAFRLAGDGLYLGDKRVSHYSATEDPHLFRLFHHGVRQLAFRAGIGREDILAFLESVTADMSQPEFAEEDVITTLWARGINGIQWVVIETFTEVTEDEDEAGAGARASNELASFLGEAGRARLAADLGEGVDAAGANALALTSADVRFFAAESVASLLEALPKAREGVGSVYGIDPAECEALHELIAKQDPLLAPRYLEALLAATVGSLGEEDASATAHSIAAALAAIARQSGLGAIGEVQARLVEWLRSAGPANRLAAAVLEIVLGGALLTTTLASLDECGQADFPVVLSLLASAPGKEVPRIARDLAAAKSSERRGAGFRVLLERPDGPNILAPLVFELSEQVALELLDATAASPSAAPGAFAIWSSAVTHQSAAVRRRAAQLLGQPNIPAALEPLARALFDSDSTVRLHAMRGLAATRNAAPHLKDALQSPRFGQLPLQEKRTVALLFAHLEGMRAAPLFHMLLGRKAMLGQTQNDEIRAAMAAGLGYIPDPRAQPALEKLAKTRFVTVPLRAEARKVATALAAGQPAYRQEDIHSLLALPVEEPTRSDSKEPKVPAAALKLATGAYATATPPMGTARASSPPPSPGPASSPPASPLAASTPTASTPTASTSPRAASSPPAPAVEIPPSASSTATAAQPDSPSAVARDPMPSSPRVSELPKSVEPVKKSLPVDLARMLEDYVLDDAPVAAAPPAAAPAGEPSGAPVPTPEQPTAPLAAYFFEDDHGGGFKIPSVAPPAAIDPPPAPAVEAEQPPTAAPDEDLEALLRDYLEDAG